jgi:hypothetical protein
VVKYCLTNTILDKVSKTMIPAIPTSSKVSQSNAVTILDTVLVFVLQYQYCTWCYGLIISICLYMHIASFRYLSAHACTELLIFTLQSIHTSNYTFFALSSHHAPNILQRLIQDTSTRSRRKKES